MSQSIWAYFVVMMGIVALLAINYVGAFANNNEIDFYALREAQSSAMMDSVDFLAYREDGSFRINRETFIEQFTKRFASATNNNRRYQIEFTKIQEDPPFTHIRVRSEPNVSLFRGTGSTDPMRDPTDDSGLWIENRMNGILILDEPVFNIAESTNEPPACSVNVMYSPCPFDSDGNPITSAPMHADVTVRGIETDNQITNISVTRSPNIGTPISGQPNTWRMGPTTNNQNVEVRATVTDIRGQTGECRATVRLGGTCRVVTRRPTISCEPIARCAMNAVNSNVRVTAPYITDIHYRIVRDGAIVQSWRVRRNVDAATIRVEQTGNLEAIAVPAGAPRNSDQQSMPAICNYTIINTAGDANNYNRSTFEVRPAPGTAGQFAPARCCYRGNYITSLSPGQWTSCHLNVTLNPNFRFADARHTTQQWSWWTATCQGNNCASFESPFRKFTYNLGRSTKQLSGEGRRTFEAQITIPTSRLGPGCPNMSGTIIGRAGRVTVAPGSGNQIGNPGWFGIDQQRPTCAVTTNNANVNAGRWTNAASVTVTGRCANGGLSGCDPSRSQSSQTFNFPAGSASVHFPTIPPIFDNACNSGICGPQQIMVDRIRPTCRIERQRLVNGSWVNASAGDFGEWQAGVRVRGVCQNNHGGAPSNCAPANNGGATAWVTRQGDHSGGTIPITGTVRDNAGNISNACNTDIPSSQRRFAGTQTSRGTITCNCERVGGCSINWSNRATASVRATWNINSFGPLRPALTGHGFGVNCGTVWDRAPWGGGPGISSGQNTMTLTAGANASTTNFCITHATEASANSLGGSPTVHTPCSCPTLRRERQQVCREWASGICIGGWQVQFRCTIGNFTSGWVDER